MTIADMTLTTNAEHPAAAVAYGMQRGWALVAAAQVAMEGDYSGPRVLREPRRETAAGKVGGVVVAARPGRNEPCPCGSGLKHKRCCGGAK